MRDFGVHDLTCFSRRRRLKTELARDTQHPLHQSHVRREITLSRSTDCPPARLARARQEAAPASGRNCALPIALTLKIAPPADDLPSVENFGRVRQRALGSVDPEQRC